MGDCMFAKGEFCTALACYSDEDCSAKDRKGRPQYADTENCVPTPEPVDPCRELRQELYELRGNVSRVADRLEELLKDLRGV